MSGKCCNCGDWVALSRIPSFLDHFERFWSVGKKRLQCSHFSEILSSLFFQVCCGDFRRKSFAHFCAVSLWVPQYGSFPCKNSWDRMKIKILEPTYLRKMTENQGRSESWNFLIQWRSSWTPRRFLCAMRSSWNIHPCFRDSLEITLRFCSLFIKIVPNICSQFANWLIFQLCGWGRGSAR